VKVLYFDCFSGASGDMVVGALIDAGVPIEEIRRSLGSLSIGQDAVSVERVTRAGISATKFCVRGDDTIMTATATTTITTMGMRLCVRTVTGRWGKSTG
jgi:uncharacterized protein (DUF111 family)